MAKLVKSGAKSATAVKKISTPKTSARKVAALKTTVRKANRGGKRAGAANSLAKLTFISSYSEPKSSGGAVKTALVFALAQLSANGESGYEILNPKNSPLSKNDLTTIAKDYLPALGATGAEGNVVKFLYPVAGKNQLLIFVGLGKADDFANLKVIEKVRRAAGVAVMNCEKNLSLTLCLPAQSYDLAKAVAEGALLGNYSFYEFKPTTAPKSAHRISQIYLLSSLAESAGKEISRSVEIAASATYLARDLINTPPNVLNPISFTQIAKAQLAGTGITAKIYDEKQLAAQGFGGLIGVGQGSVNPPRLLHLSYAPTKTSRTKALKQVALVGKGITFDSGGLALKPANGMEDMKSDMSGAAVVVGTIIAAAKLKLPIQIDAWAALAENMPSDTAQRPSDIITIYGGTTVEVINPDAEGRLVLADALVRAQEVARQRNKGVTLAKGAKGTARASAKATSAENEATKNAAPLDAIIDVATLTGAQGVALGTRVSAAMGNDPALSQEFLTAAEKTGEMFWPMPLPSELRPSLESPVADIANMGERMGGMLVAGLFLQHFIAEGQPWLHLDIASPALNTATPWGYTPLGGTGVALRSLLQYLSDLSR